MSVPAPRPPCKPRQRSLAIVIAPSPGQPDALVRLTKGGGLAGHYWLSAMPSDYGRAFKVERQGTEGTASYDVLLDEDGDSCTCPGHTYHGHCKHADSLRALDRLGKLPLRVSLKRAQ